LGDLINVDYSAIATKYGSEASQVLRKAVSGIFMAKVPSIPKTEEALLNQLRNFNSVSILAMPNQVVQWLQKSGCIRSESSGSNESAASLFSSNDERIEYVWEICYEALDNLIDDERRRSLNSSRERDASAMDVDQQNTSLEGLIASHPISSISTWQQLPLRKSQTLSASVSRRGWSTPLLLQQLVAPVVLGSDNVPASCDICIEAPKAAGKTGCYLVPLLDMTDVEIQLPQYIVVVPTREVAEQLETDFIETGGRDLGITVKCCAGGSDKSVDLQASQIIVGSPQRLAELLKRKMFPTSGIQMIVFDDVEQALAKNEADVASVLSSFALTKTRVMFIGTRQLDDTIPSRFKRLRREILSRSSELFSVTVDPALGYKGLLSNKISHKIQTILEEKLRNGAVQQAMAASPFRQCVIVVPDKQRAAQITKTLKADKNLSVFGLVRTLYIFCPMLFSSQN
jgi:superfamily II DNA/RNA helicase